METIWEHTQNVKKMRNEKDLKIERDTGKGKGMGGRKWNRYKERQRKHMCPGDASILIKVESSRKI